MPLTLVTGPANAGKAGRILGAYRDRIAEEPVLVVPAWRDVLHAQRELAGRGAVFGTRVVRFRWLFQPVAERAGAAVGRPRFATPAQRELLVEHAIATAQLDALAASAARPGFARAADRFFGELGRASVDPARFWQARRALDALRENPESWGRSPVFAYGFDDFDPLQLELIELLAGPAAADVAVS